MKPTTHISRSALALITLLSICIVCCSSIIDVYFPSGEELNYIAVAAEAKRTGNYTGWFTHGISPFFNVYPEWYSDRSDFLRPIPMAIYLALYELIGEHYSSYIIFNYTVLLIVAYGVYAIAYERCKTFDGALLLAILVFVVPAARFSIYTDTSAIWDMAGVLPAALFYYTIEKRGYYWLPLVVALCLLFKETLIVVAPLAVAHILWFNESLDRKNKTFLVASVCFVVVLWVIWREWAFGGAFNNYASGHLFSSARGVYEVLKGFSVSPSFLLEAEEISTGTFFSNKEILFKAALNVLVLSVVSAYLLVAISNRNKDSWLAFCAIVWLAFIVVFNASNLWSVQFYVLLLILLAGESGEKNIFSTPALIALFSVSVYNAQIISDVISKEWMEPGGYQQQQARLNSILLDQLKEQKGTVYFINSYNESSIEALPSLVGSSASLKTLNNAQCTSLREGVMAQENADFDEEVLAKRDRNVVFRNPNNENQYAVFITLPQSCRFTFVGSESFIKDNLSRVLTHEEVTYYMPQRNLEHAQFSNYIGQQILITIDKRESATFIGWSPDSMQIRSYEPLTTTEGQWDALVGKAQREEI